MWVNTWLEFKDLHLENFPSIEKKVNDREYFNGWIKEFKNKKWDERRKNLYGVIDWNEIEWKGMMSPPKFDLDLNDDII